MEPIGERQRWAWMGAALLGLAAACLCGYGWLWVLLGGIAATGFLTLLDRTVPAEGLAASLSETMGTIGVAICGLLLGWTVVVLAWCANLADTAFPMVDGYPALGLTLLVLAAWGSGKGSRAGAACAGVLTMILVVLYGVIIGFTLPDAELENLKPGGPEEEVLWSAGMFLFLVPLWFLPSRRKSKKLPWLVFAFPLVAAVMAAVTAGVLTPELAAKQKVPFYLVAQSVSILGVVERIEPLLSAAMTMGIFCLLSAQVCACEALGGALGWKKGCGAVACLAAASAMGMARSLSIPVLTYGSAIAYGLVPILYIVVYRVRKAQSEDK